MTVAIDESGVGEPLVLIHGLGTDRRVWRDVAPILGPGHRLIAVDLPGFGESAPAGSGFDLDEVALVVAQALEDRVGGKYDLLGHSLGGAVALSLARQRPERVRSLILSAPAGFHRRPLPLAIGVAAAAPVLLRGRRLIGEHLLESGSARRLLLWGAINDAARISPERARFMLDASRSARRLRPAAQTALSADLADELSAVEVPVGLIWGTRDPLMPASTADAITSCRPEAPLELVPEAGHVAQVDRPDRFALAVENVLAELRGHAAARPL